MALLPSGEGSLRARRKDLINQLRAARSRCREGRWCKLDYSADCHSSSFFWKGCLGPDRILPKAYIHDVTQDGSEEVIISLYLGGEEA